jgi:hypothetical protein
MGIILNKLHQNTLIYIKLQYFQYISIEYKQNQPGQRGKGFATLSAMGRRIKRFRRRVLFTVFVLLASAAFYVGEHFYRGGTVSDLSEKVQRHYASAQEGWTKTQSIAGSAKDRVQDLVEARPAVDEEQGSIAIYFAPNEELNP